MKPRKETPQSGGKKQSAPGEENAQGQPGTGTEQNSGDQQEVDKPKEVQSTTGARTPTVGRMVNYFANREEGQERVISAQAATVVAVNENNVVNLQVITDTPSGLLHRQNVKHKSAVNPDTRAESYWDWPEIK